MVMGSDVGDCDSCEGCCAAKVGCGGVCGKCVLKVCCEYALCQQLFVVSCVNQPLALLICARFFHLLCLCV